jgi:diadenylate cyclase
MTGQTIGFYISACLVFLAMMWRIAVAKSLHERIMFYLFFILYFGLFAYPFLWMEAPAWLTRLNAIFFILGTLWFLWGPAQRLLQKFHESRIPFKELRQEKGGLYEIVAASRLLSQARQGALMAVERSQSLDEWCKKGIPLDAKITRDLLFAVFTPPGALHDGATLLNKNRLMASGVIFPLTQDPHFPKELGTRHRAALGFSEITDALCVVVSEESGSVSLADRGSLYYDIPSDKLPEFLEMGLRFRLKKDKALFQTYELANL